MTNIRFKNMYCAGYIGFNGENYIKDDRDNDFFGFVMFNEVALYFYNKLKHKPGSVIFFNKVGNMVVKHFTELTIDEVNYFSLFRIKRKLEN